jgi:hypothetical protein
MRGQRDKMENVFCTVDFHEFFFCQSRKNISISLFAFFVSRHIQNLFLCIVFIHYSNRIREGGKKEETKNNFFPAQKID